MYLGKGVDLINSIDKVNKLALDVMNISRNSLIVNLRFMDKAISMLHIMPEVSIQTIVVNGKNIVFNPIYVLKKFNDSKEETTRLYLHMVFHCVFQHFWINTLVDQRLWDLACDIAVENTINDLNLSAVACDRQHEQVESIEAMKKKVKYITADVLYRYFLDVHMSEEQIHKLETIFRMDDHFNWYIPSEVIYENEETDIENSDNPRGHNSGDKTGIGKKDKDQAGSGDSEKTDVDNKLQDEWKNIARQMKMDLETFSKEHGSDAGGLTQNLLAVNKEKYDYEKFLKKFAVLCENMKINDDEFDYIFYTYGLQLFEKMPLIEPLEYKDTKRIKEFVIAIDTSGSTSGELVQKFITKTYNILKQEETFSTKFNLHVVQCDAEIQESVKITSQEEFDKYIENMGIRGLGGTDFRPVFSYVDSMIHNKEFRNLKGMIFFTDGFGVFPVKQPDYEVAFVYVNDGYENPDVPVWAIKLVLDPDEIKGEYNEH